MSLYAIGDLHLSLGVGKPMDIFGGGWSNYVEKIEKGFSCLCDGDVCVLCGDTSWGMTLEESLPDFKFLSALPGSKLILKGNHDYWWSTSAKMKAFFAENGIKDIDILYNNSFQYENSAICGTRGWSADDGTATAHDRKIIAREAARLELSLNTADASLVKLCFFHYPPIYKNSVSTEIIETMKRHGVSKCWYGHIHGHGHRFAVQGITDGLDYKMVSADFVDFVPQKVL